MFCLVFASVRRSETNPGSEPSGASSCGRTISVGRWALARRSFAVALSASWKVTKASSTEPTDVRDTDSCVQAQGDVSSRTVALVNTLNSVGQARAEHGLGIGFST